MPRPSKQPDERLPVNPRRKKVAPDQRKRVALACNNCNQKRIKCSGESPCRQCSQGARECRYPARQEKVAVPKAELEMLRARLRHAQQRNHVFERLLEQSSIPFPPEPAQTPPPPSAIYGVPGSPYDEAAMADGAPGSPSGSPFDEAAMDDAMDHDAESSNAQEDRDQGKLLTDTDGTERYLGANSGAINLDNIKEFIVTIYPLIGGNSRYSSFLASRGRYQTFDSRPMNLTTADPLWLPSEAEMAAMLTQVSIYIRDGHRAFPSGGIFYWPWKDVNGITDSPRSSRMSTRQLALYHVVFAFASLLKGEPSEQYFGRAWALLGNPLDISLYTLDDVPVLALMALYLVENNRRDAAYSCISNAVHVSIMFGTHRGAHDIDEGRRRTFWTVYILDRWLSCLMGRPTTIPEDAITLPLPQEDPNLPSPAGLIANIRLAQISNDIIQQSYSIGTPRDNYVLVDTVLKPLEDWKEENPEPILPEPILPEFPARDPAENPPKPFQGDRAYLSLHMYYNQLVVMTIRPAFLSAVKKLVADRYLTPQVNRWGSFEKDANVEWYRKIGDAARQTLHIGNAIWQFSQLLVADLHHIFNAAIILLMHRVSFVNFRTRDTAYIAWAKARFEEAQSRSEYAKDCLAVLTDMDSQVDGLRETVFSENYAIPWLDGQTRGNEELERCIGRLRSWQKDGSFDQDDDDMNQYGEEAMKSEEDSHMHDDSMSPA